MCLMVVFTMNLNPQKSVGRFTVAKPADFLQTIMDWQFCVVGVFFGARHLLFHLMSTENHSNPIIRVGTKFVGHC